MIPILYSYMDVDQSFTHQVIKRIFQPVNKNNTKKIKPQVNSVFGKQSLSLLSKQYIRPVQIERLCRQKIESG